MQGCELPTRKRSPFELAKPGRLLGRIEATPLDAAPTKRNPMNSPRHPLSALLLCGLHLLIPNVLAQAGGATWNLNPTTGDWNTAANWTPAAPLPDNPCWKLPRATSGVMPSFLQAPAQFAPRASATPA